MPHIPFTTNNIIILIMISVILANFPILMYMNTRKQNLSFKDNRKFALVAGIITGALTATGLALFFS